MYNFNYLQALIGPVTQNDIKAICEVDAKLTGSHNEIFISQNLAAYSVLITTWVSLFPTTPLRVLQLEALKKYGLIEIINQAKIADVLLLKGEDIPSSNPYASIVSQLIIYDMSKVRSNAVMCGFQGVVKNPRLMKFIHQLLVYATRFTPPYAPYLDERSLLKFKNTQRKLANHDKIKVNDRQWLNSNYSRFTSDMRDYIATILPWSEICEKIRSLISEPAMQFSPGANAFVGRAPGNKVKSLLDTHPELFHGIYGSSCSLMSNNTDEPGASQGFLVPKSASVKRFIAAEPVYKQMICLGVFNILDPYLREIGIDLHDQDGQRHLCQAAGATGKVATTDVSDASDSITRVNYRDLFPREFCDLTEPFLPTAVDVTVNGRKERINLTSRMTMGNAITFACECIIFFAADYIAGETYDIFHSCEIIDTTPEGPVLKYLFFDNEYLPLPGVYGDDQAHDSRLTPLLKDILDCIGFTINMDKSYWGADAYRESCGVEYCYDYDITPVRFPRRTINGTVDGKGVSSFANDSRRDSRSGEWYDVTSTLISLQKKLLEKGFSDAAEIVTAYICVHAPNMTFSPVGSDCDDLWGYLSRDKEQSLLSYAITSEYAVNTEKGLLRIPRGDIADKVAELMQDKDTCTFDEGDDIFSALVRFGAIPTMPSPVNGLKRRCVYAVTGRIDEIIDEPWVGYQPKRYVWVKRVKPMFIKASSVKRVHTLHLGPSVKFTLSDDEYKRLKSDRVLIAALCEWRYNLFLQKGPTYQHGPDEVLGIIERQYSISDPLWDWGPNQVPSRKCLEQLFGEPVIIWKEKAE